MRFILAAIAFLFLPAVSYAAEVTFSPAAVSLTPAQTQLVMILLVPGSNERINAFDVTLNVPAAVNAASVTPIESAAVIWLTRPVFDEASRVIRLKGGFTVPVSTATVLARFMVSASAAAKVSVAPTSAALAADGQGTPLPLTAGQLTLDIKKLPAGDALALTSPTHPNQIQWSKVKTWTIQWPAVSGAAYTYTLTRAGAVAPIASGAVTLGEITFPNLADGIYTIAIAVEGQSLHGAERTALIDATPPEPFSVRVERNPAIGDNKPFLVFETYDIMSGVAGYEIRRDLSGPFQVAVSPYIINDPTIRQVTVRAIDRAGNVREETVQLVKGFPWAIAVAVLVVAMLAAVVLRKPKIQSSNAKSNPKSQ